MKNILQLRGKGKVRKAKCQGKVERSGFVMLLFFAAVFSVLAS